MRPARRAFSCFCGFASGFAGWAGWIFELGAGITTRHGAPMGLKYRARLYPGLTPGATDVPPLWGLFLWLCIWPWWRLGWNLLDLWDGLFGFGVFLVVEFGSYLDDDPD